MAKTAGKGAPRSRFVQQLWDTLSINSPDLCWDGADRFRISGDDQRSRSALAAGGFEFRSLSSFVRQLSYYGFKRLSDRRRSGDRLPAAQSFIVFSHPSGHFSRDNREDTSLIVRKLRARKRTTIRRGSSASSEQDQELELDDEPEGDEDTVKIATPEEYDSEEPRSTEVHQPIYHEQAHQDSYSSASLKMTWAGLSLPPRAQDHWQQSPYPSPLNAPFPSPLHTPSNATFGLPPQAYSFNHAGSSSPGYFQPPIAPTAIPPALVEGKFDHQVGSSVHYHPTGMVAGVAPPSPANSSSGSDADSNQQHTGFVSPAPAPSRTLLGLYSTASASDHHSFAANPNAETHRKPAQYYTLPNHDFSTLYGHTTSSD